MHPDHLESFLAVAQVGSVNRAATALHRSQPNVTRQIQLLERDLDTTLFDRASDGMRLTAAGRALLPVAESIAAAFAEARRAVRIAVSGRSGPVSIAVVGTLADDDLVQTLNAFRARCPNARVKIGTGLSPIVSAMVRRGDVDVGLRYGVDDDALLECTIIAHEPVIAIAAPDHPLTRRRTVTPSMVSTEQWFVFESATKPSDEPYTAALQATFAMLNVATDNLSTVDSLSAQKTLVRAGLGLALLPASAARPELDTGRLVSLPLSVRPRTAPIVLVRRRHAFITATTRELVDTIITHYQSSRAVKGHGLH